MQCIVGYIPETTGILVLVFKHPKNPFLASIHFTVTMPFWTCSYGQKCVFFTPGAQPKAYPYLTAKVYLITVEETHILIRSDQGKSRMLWIFRNMCLFAGMIKSTQTLCALSLCFVGQLDMRNEQFNIFLGSCRMSARCASGKLRGEAEWCLVKRLEWFSAHWCLVWSMHAELFETKWKVLEEILSKQWMTREGTIKLPKWSGQQGYRCIVYDFKARV